VGRTALRGAVKRAREQKRGVRWGCMSQHRSSRFVVAFSGQPTEQEAAAEVVPLTRERTAGRRGIRWISDGLRAYRDLIATVYRDPVSRRARGRGVLTPGVGLTQIVKHRVGGRVTRITVRHCFGERTLDPYTVRMERLNGCLRDRLGCITRSTHGFTKRVRTWYAFLGMGIFEHNWLRPHPALRQEAGDLPKGHRYHKRTPAMAIGLTHHVWSWTEFLTQRVSHC
jgi:hypothetical protein